MKKFPLFSKISNIFHLSSAFILSAFFFLMFALFSNNQVSALPPGGLITDQCMQLFGDEECILPGVGNITPTISTFTVKGNSAAESGYTNTTSVTVTISGTNISYYQIVDGSTTIYAKQTAKPTSVTLANTTNGTHVLKLTVWSSTSNTATKSASIILDTVAPVITVTPNVAANAYTSSRTYTVTLTETNVRATSPSYYFSTSSAGSRTSTWCTSYSHTSTSISFSETSLSKTITKSSVTGTYYLFIERVSDKAGNYSSYTHTTVVSQKTGTGTTMCTMLGGDSSWTLYYYSYGSFLFDNQSVSITTFSATGNSGADAGYTNTRELALSITASASYYEITTGSTTLYAKSSSKPTSLTLPASEGSYTLTLKVYSTGSVSTATKTYTMTYDATAPVISVSSNVAGSTYTTSRQFTVTLTEANARATSPSYYFSDKAVGITSSIWCTSYSHTTTSISFTESNKTATITKGGLTGTYYLFIERVSDKAGNYSTYTNTTLVKQQSSTGTTMCTLPGPDSSWSVYYNKYGSYLYDNQSVSITTFSATGNSGADTGYTNTRELALSINASGYYYEIKSGTTSLYNKSTTKPTTLTLPASEGTYTLTLNVYSIGSVSTASKTYTMTYDATAPVISVSPSVAGTSWAATRNFTVTLTETNVRSTSPSYYFSDKAVGITSSSWCTGYSHTTTSISFTATTKSVTINKGGLTGTYYLFIERVSDKAGNYSTHSNTTNVSQAASTGTTMCSLSSPDSSWSVYYNKYGSYLYDNQSVSITTFSATGNSGADAGYTNTRELALSINASGYYYEIKSGSTSLYNKSTTKPTALTLPASEGSYPLTLTVYSIGGLNTRTATYTMVYDITAPVISVSANVNGSTYTSSRQFTITLTETNVRSTSPSYYFSDKTVGIASSTWCTGYSHTTTSISFTATTKSVTVTNSSLTGTYYLFIERVSDKAGNYSTHSNTTYVSQASSTGTTMCILPGPDTNWSVYYNKYGTYNFDNQNITLTSFTASGNSAADAGYTNTRELALSITGNGYYYEIKSGSTSLYNKSTTKPTALTLPTSEGSYPLTLTISSIGGLTTRTATYTMIYDKTAPVINVSANVAASNWAASRTYTVTLTETNVRSTSPNYYFYDKTIGIESSTWCTSYSHTTTSISFTESTKTATISKGGLTGSYYLFIERVSDKAGNYSVYTNTTYVSQAASTGTTMCTLSAPDSTWTLYYNKYGAYKYDNQSVSISSFTAKGNIGADDGYSNTRTVSVSISASASYYQIKDAHGTTTDILYAKSSNKPTEITLPDDLVNHKLTLVVYSIGSLNTATKDFNIVYDNVKPVISVSPDTTGTTWSRARSFTVTLTEINVRNANLSYYFSTNENGIANGTWCTSYNYADGDVAFSSTSKVATIQKFGLSGVYYLFIEGIRDRAGNYSDVYYSTTVTQASPKGNEICTLGGDTTWTMSYNRYGYYLYDNEEPVINTFKLEGNTSAEDGYTNITTLSVTIDAEGTYYELSYGSTVKYSKSATKPTTVTIPNTEGSHTITLKMYSIGGLLTTTKDYTITYDVTAPSLTVSPNSDSVAKKERTISVKVNEVNPRDNFSISYYFHTKTIGIAASEWCSGYEHIVGYMTFTKSSLTKTITHVPGLGDYYLFLETITDKAGNTMSHTNTTKVTQVISSTTMCILMGPDEWDVYYNVYGTYRYDPIIPNITSISVTGNAEAQVGYTNNRNVLVKFAHTSSSYYHIVDSVDSKNVALTSVTATNTTLSSSTEVNVNLVDVQGKHTVTVYVYSPYKANIDQMTYEIIYDTVGPTSQIEIDTNSHTLTTFFTDTHSLGGERLSVNSPVHYIMSPKVLKPITLNDDNTTWLVSYNPIELLTGATEAYHIYLKYLPALYVDRAGNNLLSSTDFVAKDIDNNFVIFHHVINDYVSDNFIEHSVEVGETVSNKLFSAANKYRSGIGSGSIEFNDTNTLVTRRSQYTYTSNEFEARELMNQGYVCMKEAANTPHSCTKTTTTSSAYKNEFIINVSAESQIIITTITKIHDASTLILEINHAVSLIMNNEPEDFLVTPIGVSSTNASNADASIIVQNGGSNYLIPLLILNNTPIINESNSSASEVVLNKGEELGNIAVSFIEEETLNISTLITHNGVKVNKIDTEVPGVYTINYKAENIFGGISEYKKTVVINNNNNDDDMITTKTEEVNVEEIIEEVIEEINSDAIISENNTIVEIKIIEMPKAIIEMNTNDNEENKKDNKKKNKEDNEEDEEKEEI